jgi:hypothetical protein
MTALKTKQNDLSVEAFLKGIEDETMREDCLTVLNLMKQESGEKPRMWGTSIVGFGRYHYRYESGHEGDCCLIGFSPRKQALTLYIMPGLERYGDLLDKLGKHKTGKSCLYIKKIADIDLPTLKKLIQQSLMDMSKSHA